MLFNGVLQYFLGSCKPSIHCFAIMGLVIILLTLTLAAQVYSQINGGRTCTVQASGDIDAVPAIEAAFQACGHNPTGSRGKVVFLNQTYHINTFMNTTYLQNVDIDLQGTLLWSTDIQYWLSASQPVGFQNQSSAWWFGGEGIHWYGHGYGTLNGNGQVWYDFINGQSNYPKRPHQITIRNTTNSVFEGIRFIQSQMW